MKEYSLDDFAKYAKEFTENLSLSKEGATILALHGDLGAGKTTFTQILARTLGVTEDVVSPTFVIQKNYSLEGAIFSQLIHIDAYRLDNAKQLEVLGWHDIVADQSNLIVIEWPEHIEELLPEYAQHIYFEYVNETTRGISYGEKN